MSAIPAGLREAVYRRDMGRCQRCATPCPPGSDRSIHHRRPRGMGGTARPDVAANLVLICGSGTTGCHGRIESHRREALQQGWLVRSHDDPATEMVLRWSARPGAAGWFLLGDVWTPLPAFRPPLRPRADPSCVDPWAALSP